MREIAETDHASERRVVYEEELDISQFELEGEKQTCMVDFPLKPYADVDYVQAQDALDNEHHVPINYYDNDDGFWDEWIAMKEQRAFDANYITNRRWFKH